MSAAWTDDEIRSATPFPKPQGALDRYRDNSDGLDEPAEEPTVGDRLLAQALELGDYIRIDPCEATAAGVWLLVPLPWWLLDAIEQHEAERADLEETAEREPEIEELDTADDEPNGDDEPNTGDDEPELYDGGHTGGYPMPPDPRSVGPIPVFASRPKVPAEPITHPVLGVYRRLYPPVRRSP